MESDPVLARIRTIGTVAAWIVLAVLAAAVIYTAAIAVMNWGAIGV